MEITAVCESNRWSQHIIVLTMLPEGGVNSSNSVLSMGGFQVVAGEHTTE